jgi:hypothetical protein
MTTTPTRNGMSRWQSVNLPAVRLLSLLNIAVKQYWPESIGATIVGYLFLSWVVLWLRLTIRDGYLRRKPYWTRDSWLRYGRLAIMPVIALGLVLFLSSFDMSSNALGAPRSPTRTTWAVIVLAMMLIGVAGLMRALDWMTSGEPATQFTRTRWFQRQRPSG